MEMRQHAECDGHNAAVSLCVIMRAERTFAIVRSARVCYSAELRCCPQILLGFEPQALPRGLDCTIYTLMGTVLLLPGSRPRVCTPAAGFYLSCAVCAAAVRLQRTAAHVAQKARLAYNGGNESKCAAAEHVFLPDGLTAGSAAV